MIVVHRLNGTEFVLNCELIETIQSNPDTTIRLTTGNLYIVQESRDEVVSLARSYKQDIFTGLLRRDDI